MLSGKDKDPSRLPWLGALHLWHSAHPLAALSRLLVETFDVIVDDGRRTHSKGIHWPTTLIAVATPRGRGLKLGAL
jgi:hypothetical protein